jgi:hypothetical protein
MIERKRRLIFIQLILLIFGLLILYNTYYYNKDSNPENEIISKATEEKIKTKNSENEIEEGDLFFNIEYTGLDLSGNRYLLKSEEAYLDELKPEVVYMKKVHAIFYFKDDTILYVWSDKGIYNNKTLDMKFENNVKANYLESELFADKADYSNSESYLSIYENVKINDIQGNLVADKLLFDITKQKLDITSFNDGKINANVNLNEKRF